MTTRQHYEIVVVGGGLTGVMMAIALSYGGYGTADMPAIALIDRAKQDGTKTGNSDLRTTTIHAAGKAMFEALGIWQYLEKCATPIACIKIANGLPTKGGLARRRRPEFSLDWHDVNQPMAYVVGNEQLLEALYRVMKTRPITPIYDAEVSHFDGAGDLARLQFADRPDLTAQLVVACDGAASKLRDHAGIRTLAEAHRQSAIVANVTLEIDHNDTAYQRFLPSGPLALMPHGPHRASLVWTLPKEEADRILAVDETEFSNLLLAAFGDTLGGLKLDSRRLIWPLKPTITRQMTSNHLVLAGDASHAIHPLAGQGYNLALGDAAVLADCLARARARGLSAGHRSVESDYLAGRKLEVTAMTAMTSGLNRLMSFQPAIAKAASAGMGLVNTSPVKTLFQKSAMGGHLARANLLAGRLP